MIAARRDPAAWASEVAARLRDCGAHVEVDAREKQAILKIRPLFLVRAGARDGRLADPATEPDGDHLAHEPGRFAAVLTLYASGTALWQGEPGEVARWRSDPGPLPDRALGASRVSPEEKSARGA